MIGEEITKYIETDVLTRFLRYVQVYTTSDPDSKTNPSTARQIDLLKILKQELEELGLADIELDGNSFLYATLSGNVEAQPFGLLAHVDTSPDQPGEGVKPRVVKNWQGEPIRYPDDPNLVLEQKLSPELKKFIGDSIIVASGKTLLGADDKAGVAEIMAALATFKKFPELKHGPITVCFTCDEEIGRGVDGINLKRLPKFCYTMDGGEPGELEDECFDAWKVVVKIQGVGVHPGYAKGKMINAAAAAARFMAALPEKETPEHTSGKEGFIHLTDIKGDHENAALQFILRDFVETENKRRIERFEALAQTFRDKYPGIVITIESKAQYKNMKRFVEQHPMIIERAERAIEATGLELIRKAIRGGTDGSRLSEMGIPTPNIFAGGLLFHSRTEWIAHSALTKAVETIVHLAANWVK